MRREFPGYPTAVWLTTILSAIGGAFLLARLVPAAYKRRARNPTCRPTPGLVFEAPRLCSTKYVSTSILFASRRRYVD